MPETCNVSSKVRIDKWLWSVRVFKTRSIAADACNKGRVLLNEKIAKPSKEVNVGDIIIVRKPPVIYTCRVLQLLTNRLSAKLVHEYMEDLTSEEELDKLRVKETLVFHRDRGTGRPTKRDRRQIDKLRDIS